MREISYAHEYTCPDCGFSPCRCAERAARERDRELVSTFDESQARIRERKWAELDRLKALWVEDIDSYNRAMNEIRRGPTP